MIDVLFHPEAQAEYLNAIKWYRTRSARAASRFEAEVARTINLICDSPDSFPQYDIAHRYALLKGYPFCIVYQFHQTPDSLAHVVAIAHTSRYQGYWHDRR